MVAQMKIHASPKRFQLLLIAFRSITHDVYVAITQMHMECQPDYVERRMDPLSRELAGIILPHDAYGSH